MPSICNSDNFNLFLLDCIIVVLSQRDFYPRFEMNRKRLRRNMASENDFIHEMNDSNSSIQDRNYDKDKQSNNLQSITNFPEEEPISYPVFEHASVTDSNLEHDLAIWTKQHQISHIALTSLQQILRKKCSCFGFPNLNEEEDPLYIQKLPNMRKESNEGNSSVAHNTNFEQKYDNFQRFIVYKLINLEMKINQIEKHINTFQKFTMCDIVEDKENIDIFKNLPLRDENELQLMETKLKNDLWYRQQMIKQLGRVTSKHLKMSCLRLMRAILSNEVAEKYSWYGAKKKQVFCKLEICKVIMSVVRKYHADITDEEIAAPIKVWLVHARDRMKEKRSKIESQ